MFVTEIKEYIYKNDKIPFVLDNLGCKKIEYHNNKDYYYILRETKVSEPLLIEYGFIDNANDANKLRNNLNDYAEAVVKAVTEYAGYTYALPGEIPNLNKDVYIVKRGDTLYSIARDNNITVAVQYKLYYLIDYLIVLIQQL